MTNLEQALQVLVDAKQETLLLLFHPDHGMLIISIQTKFDQMINQLKFLAGDVTNTPALPNAEKMFPPVTNFMGEPLVKPDVVTTEDLDPKAVERKLYAERVLKFQEAINTMEDKAILEAYASPMDQLVIRGAAKKAGVEDYETSLVNSDFLNQIRTGLKGKADADLKLKEAAAKLDGSDEANKAAAKDFTIAE